MWARVRPGRGRWRTGTGRSRNLCRRAARSSRHWSRPDHLYPPRPRSAARAAGRQPGALAAAEPDLAWANAHELRSRQETQGSTQAQGLNGRVGSDVGGAGVQRPTGMEVSPAWRRTWAWRASCVRVRLGYGCEGLGRTRLHRTRGRGSDAPHVASEHEPTPRSVTHGPLRRLLVDGKPAGRAPNLRARPRMGHRRRGQGCLRTRDLCTWSTRSGA